MKNIIEEANRCLNCKVKPCKKGCPLENDIPSFIKLVKQEKLKEAFEILSNTTVLGSICGRICPHKKQCMGHCVRGIKSEAVNIGKLESMVFDNAIKKNWKISKNNVIQGKKIAIVGGGPAGLTCAAFLAKNGANVTIYEKRAKLGGIIRYGIPEFRLPQNIIDANIKKILEIGINAVYNKEFGIDYTLKELKVKYDFVYLSLGANVPLKMNIEGENLNGVYGGNELLEIGNHPNYENKNVAIVGGGNVAMDVARIVKRKNAKNVYIIYRRAKEQMPAEEYEVQEAMNENIKFLFQNNILRILGDKKVEKIECVKTKLIKKPGENRDIPVDIENSNYKINMDYVIMAVGSKTNEKIVQSTGLKTNKNGNIIVDKYGETSEKCVFAGGDLIGMKSTVAWASRSGRDAAQKIIEKCIEGDIK